MVKFKKKDQVQWLLLLSDLLKSGFSLQHAITFSETIFPKYQLLFRQINESLGEGKIFAECLRPYVNTNYYYQFMIAEQHGNLEECLSNIGKLMDTQERQRQKLGTLLQYPFILIGLLLLILVGLKVFVFPEISQWNNGSLGTPILQRVGPILVCTVGGGLAYIIRILVVWQRLDSLGRVNTLCRLPMVGKCYELYYGYYVVTNLSMMVRHGLSLKEICGLMQTFPSQSFLYLLGREVYEKVQNGEPLDKLFQKLKFLPQELLLTSKKGSTLNDLGEDLSALANILFTRLITRIERLLGLVQPTIFGIIAIVIVALYLSLLLPIYFSMQGVM